MEITLKKIIKDLEKKIEDEPFLLSLKHTNIIAKNLTKPEFNGWRFEKPNIAKFCIKDISYYHAELITEDIDENDKITKLRHVTLYISDPKYYLAGRRVNKKEHPKIFDLLFRKVGEYRKKYYGDLNEERGFRNDDEERGTPR
jgi:hypothetical protein